MDKSQQEQKEERLKMSIELERLKKKVNELEKVTEELKREERVKESGWEVKQRAWGEDRSRLLEEIGNEVNTLHLEQQKY